MMQGLSEYRAPDCHVTCLNDGYYTFDRKDFPDVADDVIAARLRSAGLTTIDTEFAAYLLRFGDGETMLVDSGCGSRFGVAGGLLPERLAVLGVRAGDVQRVVLTHMHTDHIGGLLAGLFPDAELILHRVEAAYWRKRDHPAAGLLAGRAKLRLVDDATFIRPGLSVWSLPGHTPGHIGLRIGDGLVLIGDAVHSEALQYPEPGLSTVNDVDRDMAATTRAAAWAEIADQGLVFSGSHLLGPEKFAKLARDRVGFRRVPLSDGTL